MKKEFLKIKMKRNTKGITLVTLVVTIIVLLILAGVSIGLVFNNSGMFQKASSATSKYSQQQAEEVLAITLQEAQMLKYSEALTNEQLDAMLNKIGKVNDTDKNLVTVDKYIFEIDRTVPKIVKYKSESDIVESGDGDSSDNNQEKGNTNPKVETIKMILTKDGRTMKFGATGMSNESEIDHFNYSITPIEGIPEDKVTGTFNPNETIEVTAEKVEEYTIIITATDKKGNTTAMENAKKIKVATIEVVNTTPQPSTEIQNDTTMQTATDGTWHIPKGFKESEESASTIKEGKVIQDEAGNQFVWVPCYVTGGTGQDVSSATEYKRTNFGCTENCSYGQISEELDSNELESIKKYGGFYIGRYESGINDSKNVVIKKNQTIYNNIQFAEIETKLGEFTSINRYDSEKLYVKLISSYAWDTTLCFIQNTEANYAKNSPQGNYSSSLKNTGLTTPTCNIYDMSGNLWDLTSEKNSNGSMQYICRGGCANGNSTYRPAGIRAATNGGKDQWIGFRATLYLK